MADTSTSFMQRPFFVGGTIGHPDGGGVRAGVLLPQRPELGIEAHAGSALFWSNAGVDLVVRPTAALFDFSPRVRVGAGGISAMPLPYGVPVKSGFIVAATLGFEYRAKTGLTLSADFGAAFSPERRSVIPSFNLTVGYSF